MEKVLQLQPEIEELKQLGVDVYYILAGFEEELRQFFERYPVDAYLIYDAKQSIFHDYDVLALPATFFVDRTRVIRQTKLDWDGNLAGGFRAWIVDLTSQ